MAYMGEMVPMGWTGISAGFWGYASAMGVLVQGIRIRRLGFMVGMV